MTRTMFHLIYSGLLMIAGFVLLWAGHAPLWGWGLALLIFWLDERLAGYRVVETARFNALMEGHKLTIQAIRFSVTGEAIEEKKADQASVQSAVVGTWLWKDPPRPS